MHKLLNRDVVAPVLALIIFQGLTTMGMHAFSNAPAEVARGYEMPVSFTGIYTAIVYFTALTFGLLVSGPFGRYGAMRSCQIALIFGATSMAIFTLATPWLSLIHI